MAVFVLQVLCCKPSVDISHWYSYPEKYVLKMVAGATEITKQVTEDMKTDFALRVVVTRFSHDCVHNPRNHFIHLDPMLLHVWSSGDRLREWQQKYSGTNGVVDLRVQWIIDFAHSWNDRE